MDRKYRQRGYQDNGKPDKKKDRAPRPPHPRRHDDSLGPRTPRMVGSVTRARCANCGAILPPDFNPDGQCPKCNAEFHSCKQCRYFDTGAQFECTQPVPAAIMSKSARNECTFFDFRVTVEKDTSPTSYSHAPAPVVAAEISPSRPHNARRAFDNLFKK